MNPVAKTKPESKHGAISASNHALIRVCHVSLSLSTGGLERLIADFSRHHDRSAFHVDYVAIREKGYFAECIEAGGEQVVCLAANSRWQTIMRLRSHFSEGRYDIVHTHNLYPHVYGTLAAKMCRVPIVINTRHGQRAGHSWRSKWLFRLASFGVDRIVAVSEDAKRLSIDSDGIDPSKTVRIWNGIDLASFPYSGPVESPIAITVGRLVGEKDYDTLIRAIHIARASVPELRLVLIGDGEERCKLERLVVELGLQSRVQFVGESRKIAEHLAKTGMYVCSSRSEGISLTLLEAMAVGLPVIATNVGGNSEVVEDGVNGVLVPASNPIALADAMVELWHQRSQWQLMGEAGRNRVEALFQTQFMVDRYQRLYLDLVEKRSA